MASTNSDFLLHNFIDHRLRGVLSPLQLCRAPASLRQYRGGGGAGWCVTPLGRRYCARSLLTVTALISLFIVDMWRDDKLIIQKAAIQLLISVGLFIIYTQNLLHSVSSVSLVVTMQRLFDSLDEAGKATLAGFRKYSWFLCVAVYLFPLAIFGVTYGFVKSDAPFSPLLPLSSLIFHLAIADSVLLVKVLSLFVSALVEKLNELACADRLCGEKESIKLVDTIETILEAYDLLKKTSRVQILLHSMKIFFQVLLLMEIFRVGHELVVNLCLITGGLLALQYAVFGYSLCVQYERFYSQLGALKVAASQVLKRRLDDVHARRASKSVLRVLRASFSRLRVVGVPVGAAFPAALAQLLAQYVLLQLQVALQ